jgi:hypothetical protein
LEGIRQDPPALDADLDLELARPRRDQVAGEGVEGALPGGGEREVGCAGASSRPSLAKEFRKLGSGLGEDDRDGQQQAAEEQD